MQSRIQQFVAYIKELLIETSVKIIDLESQLRVQFSVQKELVFNVSVDGFWNVLMNLDGQLSLIGNMINKTELINLLLSNLDDPINKDPTQVLKQFAVEKMRKILMHDNICYSIDNDDSVSIYNGSEMIEDEYQFENGMWRWSNREEQNYLFDHFELFAFVDKEGSLMNGVRECLKNRFFQQPTIPEQLCEMISHF